MPTKCHEHRLKLVQCTLLWPSLTQALMTIITVLTTAKYLGNLQCIQEESPYFPIFEHVVENFAEPKQPDTRRDSET